MITNFNENFKLVTKKLNKYADFNTCLIVLFFVFGFIGIIHHEMWRDEFQAWLLARDSSSIPNLIENMTTEGHPALWHLCLYLLSGLTHNPLAMQVFHLAIATGVISLFIKYAPFKTIHKILFSFSYFPFYEYAIISRNYNLGIFFIFLFCVLFPQRNNYFPLLAIALALLANTNIYGFIISFALALALLLEYFLERNQVNSSPSLDKLAISIIILASGWLVSLWQIIQPLQYSKQIIRPLENNSSVIIENSSVINTTDNLNTVITEIVRIAGSFSIIWKSYVPIPNIFEFEFWNTNIISNNYFLNTANLGGISASGVINYILSLILLIISLRLLIHKPVALFAYAFGTCSILLFDYFVFTGALRHQGHLFILLIACLWISNYVKSSNLIERKSKWIESLSKSQKNKFLTILLSIHVFSGIFAYTMDLAYPFSMSKQTANYIENSQLNHLIIIGTRDKQVAPLAGYLDRKIYYPERDEFGSFWNVQRKEIEEEKEIFDSAKKLLSQNEKQLLLVVNKELQSYSNKLKLEKLAKFEGAIVPNEKYYLYLVDKK